MYKACSKCGKIHPSNFKCYKGIVYRGGNERELRNKYSWQIKRDEIKSRANYLCEVCKDKGVFTYNNLEVHHIEKLSKAPKRLLDDDNLICLCEQCHELADDGEISAEYLTELARRRDSQTLPV